MPASEYLDLLAATPGEVLDEGRPLSYPQSLARSVRVAVTALTDADPAAAQLLRLCAFLAPEPIPTTWFPAAGAGALPEPLATTAAAPLAYRRTLGRLSRYGLAKLTDEHLIVHRLTQSLLRADTPDPDHTTTTVGRVLAGLTPGDPRDPGSWPAWAELLLHLQVLDLAGTTDDDLAWQAGRASGYLLRRGEFQAGHDLIQPLHSAWRETSGPIAERTLWAANYLAQCLGYLGRSHDAVELKRHLLDHYRASAGGDDPDTLAAANNLAIRLWALGEHEQARILDQDSLDRCRRIPGDNHPDTLTSAHNLANRLAALGEAEAAARLRQEFGLDEPDEVAPPEAGRS